jgi:hypothetical protein
VKKTLKKLKEKYILLRAKTKKLLQLNADVILEETSEDENLLGDEKQ